MKDWRNVTLGDIGAGASRYRPFIALLAAILIAMTVLAGDPDQGQDVAAGGPAVDLPAGGAGPGGQGVATDSPSDAATGDTVTTGGTTAGTTAGTGGRTSGGSGSGQNTSTPDLGAAPAVPEGSISANCDRARGRIAVPTLFAPPCVQVTRATTNDYQGVTKDEIVVVAYRAQTDPATDAALRAAGAADPEDAVRAQIQDFVNYWDAHYEQYGRKIKLVFVAGSGQPDDDAAGRADAINIAENIKAFAAITDPNNAFVDELVARKVICVCTTSQPQENYERWAPFGGYTYLMSSTQAYVHRAEYIGKRLAGRKATWAGSRDGVPMAAEDRKFGLLWFETADGSYKAGIDFFKRELREKYGVTLAADQSFTGAIGPGANPAQTQQQARPAIQKMKSAGVTSIAFSGDPLSPAFFTQEATRQNYFPEWIITGSALTDTSIFARTYDQNQWVRAFGISLLTARTPQEAGDAYRLQQWHHGRPPSAENSYAVIYAAYHPFFLGVHMAGPTLTPETFQQGLFRYPVTGGFITFATQSYGRHGLWDFNDYTVADDVTEIWWDPTAQGEDETGANGVGLYRYVDGGRRYLPGQHPPAVPKAFDPAGTVTIYDEHPDGSKPPEYPPPRR